MRALVLTRTQQVLSCFRSPFRPNNFATGTRLPLFGGTPQQGISRFQGLIVAASVRSSIVTAVHCQHSLAFSPAMSVLASKGDIYDGIIVDSKQLPSDAEEFAEMLQHSLEEWRQTDRKGIWLRVPITHAQLIPVATAQGFYFHHAERDYVMLAQWLPKHIEDKLPGNASHQVGVGAFVFDRQSQRVLMVQEKNGPLRGKNVWKMPTGLAMAREDVGDAAEREVLEETGVRAKACAVLAIRQAHTALFDKSDLFAVIALEPEEGSMNNIVIQQDEIEAAEWQPLAEFEANPFPHTIPLLGKIVERCTAYAKGEYAGLTAEKFVVPNRGREDLLIYGSSDSKPLAGL